MPRTLTDSSDANVAKLRKQSSLINVTSVSALIHESDEMEYQLLVLLTLLAAEIA